MPYENEHACGIRQPGEFASESFRRVKRGKVSHIYGKLKGKDTMMLQAVRYPTSSWTEADAKKNCDGMEGSFDAAKPKPKNTSAATTEPEGEMKIRHVEFIQNASKLREATLDGRRYLVAPVVLLVEGVHNKFMYTAADIEESADGWNALPITVHHPKTCGDYVSARSPEAIEKWGVGRLFNVSFDDVSKKLRGEAWIDIQKADALDPAILAMIRSGEPLEVSTGLITADDDKEGEWRGEKFLATLFGYVPDHLALLPGQQGACSWDDGCGIRANKKSKVSFTYTEEGPWPHGGLGFSDYRDAYYTHTSAERPDDADLPQSPAEAPEAMRTWIVSKTLLGDLGAKTEMELIRLPVVSSATNKLNLLALYSVSGADAAALGIDPQALEAAQKEAEILVAEHFGEDRVKSGSGTKTPSRDPDGDDDNPPLPPGPLIPVHPPNPFPRENTMNEIKRFLAKLHLIAAEEMSDDDKRSKLDELIQGKPPQMDQAPYKWIVDVYDDYFIYQVTADGKRTLHKQPYAMTDAGPALAGDPVEVVEEKTYVPAPAGEKPAGMVPAAQIPEEVIMANKELVNKLIACERTRFGECHRQWLESLSDAQLETLQAVDPPAPAPAPAPETVEELVTNAPKELQETLLRALARDKAVEEEEKAQSALLVNEVLKNPRNKFTKEQLDGKRFDELKVLVELGGGEVSFAGAAPGPSVTPPLAPPDPNDAYKASAK